LLPYAKRGSAGIHFLCDQDYQPVLDTGLDTYPAIVYLEFLVAGALPGMFLRAIRADLLQSGQFLPFQGYPALNIRFPDTIHQKPGKACFSDPR